MFAADKLWNIVHWTWTIQGVHRNQVAHHSWLEFFHILAHTCRLKLEHPHSSSFLEELIGLGIFYGDMVYVNINIVGFFDVL